MAQVTSGMLSESIKKIEYRVKYVIQILRGLELDYYRDLEQIIVVCNNLYKILGRVTPTITILFDDKDLYAIVKKWDDNIIYLIKNNRNSDDLRPTIEQHGDYTYKLLLELQSSLLNMYINPSDSSRWSNNETDQEEINELKRQLAEAREKLKNSTEDNAGLKEDVKKLKEDIEEREKALKQKEDNKEKELEERITGSFKILNEKLSILRNEEDRMKTEYVAYNFILCTLSVLVIIWLIILVVSITGKDSVKCWYTEIAPWYAPTPFVAAFFWVLIVFKNKANRYLLRIREELFKINYCEGLLLSISKLSKSTEEGAARVSDVLDTMVKSYINQIETSFLFESKKTERDTPVDASDITKAAEVITDFADKIKDIAKSK